VLNAARKVLGDVQLNTESLMYRTSDGKFVPFDLTAALAECTGADAKLCITIAEKQVPVPVATPTASSSSTSTSSEGTPAVQAAPVRGCHRWRNGNGSSCVRWADLDCDGKRRRVYRVLKGGAMLLFVIWAVCVIFGGCNKGAHKKSADITGVAWNEIGALKYANEQLAIENAELREDNLAIRQWVSDVQTRVDGLYYQAWHSAQRDHSTGCKKGDPAPTYPAHEHKADDGSAYTHSHANSESAHLHDDEGSTVSFTDLLKRATKVASSIPQQWLKSAHQQLQRIEHEQAHARAHAETSGRQHKKHSHSHNEL